MNEQSPQTGYRGRIAPSPTGYLHLGHAKTFWTALQRAQAHGGTLIFRNEDLDRARCLPKFVDAAFEDLSWFGLRWSEGPDMGGPHAPYSQSNRMQYYIEAFDLLRSLGFIYPCACSRQDVLRALSAPHQGEEEPIYPGMCRPESRETSLCERVGINWRFRVLQNEKISFKDGNFGLQSNVAGVDFGDFLVWRKDDLPSYQLAVVVDDALMGITEVVRGADLITSTFRQMLLYRALGYSTPNFYHTELMTDTNGIRLAKRNDALSLRSLRQAGYAPAQLRQTWDKS